MRIQLLDEAEDDLQDGRGFYDRQEPGVGDYFVAALAADIESLILFAGVHSVHYGFIEHSPNDSLSVSIIAWKMVLFASMPCSICGEIPLGSAAGLPLAKGDRTREAIQYRTLDRQVWG